MSRSRFDSRQPRSAAPPSIPSQPEAVTIEKLAAGGSGFARRASGEPLFVPGALPGDGVVVRQLRSHKGYGEALAWDLVSPSSDRRTPPCVYADRCGGCDMMALTTTAQRRVKHEMVVEVLRRTAHVDASAASSTPLVWNDVPRGSDSVDEQRSPDLHYRTRIRLHIDPASKLGFLAEQSHDVVPIGRCLVATDRINQVLAVLVALAELRPDLLAPFEQVEIRALGDTPELVWVPRRAPGKHHHQRPTLASVLETIERHLQSEAPQLELHLTLLNDAPKRWREFVQSAALGDSAPHTGAPLGDTHTEARLWFAPGTFTQVNWDVNRHIVANLLANAQRRGSKRFLDLYCGAGNFSLPLLSKGLHGVGIEANPTSIAAATAAAAAQDLRGKFVAEDVASGVDRLIRQGSTFDLILLDPPRAGFKEVVHKLAKLAPEYLFICACDPVTFARDLRSLLAEGFALEQLDAYDMFPQTHHVECSAWLRYAPTSSMK
jgi:23S rRNA (uracil1939-C5)-methyltransferase